MALRVLLGPLYAAILGGLCVAAFAYAPGQRLFRRAWALTTAPRCWEPSPR